MNAGRGDIAVSGTARDILARHRAWWARRSMLVARVPSAPLGDLWLPLADGTTATCDLDLTPDMLDIDRLAGEPLPPGPLRFHGDRICAESAYARIPWLEAILGCRIRATIQGGSMRAHGGVTSWQDWRGPGAWRASPWLHALLDLTERLVERSGGQYAVTHTLMRGPVDLAEAVLGPELLALSLYDHQRELRAFLDEVTEVFIGVLEEQLRRMSRVEGGYVNPFGVWAPGTVVRTQCDASAILSPRQYQEWFLPYDERICEAVDYSVIHLHSGSLHTIDALMEVERPQAIQVSLDPPPSGPPVEDLLPTFRRVLGGKSLIVDGYLTEEQVKSLLDALPHDGLYISARQTPD